MSSIFSFQKKLILLGFGSLGGIFGLNYAFKGDSDKALPQLISTEIQDKEETLILPENDAPASKVAPKVSNERPAFRFPNWRQQEDAKSPNGVNTGKLKDFVVTFFENSPRTINEVRGFSRVRLDWFIKQNMRNHPFFRSGTTIIDWDKIKAQMSQKDISYT